MIAALKDLMPLWPLFLFFCGVLVTVIGVISRQTTNKKLFRPNGQLIYVQKQECDHHKGACQSEICRKLDKLQEHMETMDEKRESARQEMAKEMSGLGREVSNLAGQFQTFNANNGNH